MRPCSIFSAWPHGTSVLNLAQHTSTLNPAVLLRHAPATVSFLLLACKKEVFIANRPNVEGGHVVAVAVQALHVDQDPGCREGTCVGITPCVPHTGVYVALISHIPVQARALHDDDAMAKAWAAASFTTMTISGRGCNGGRRPMRHSIEKKVRMMLCLVILTCSFSTASRHLFW